MIYWYYSVILAWALYYLASSCQATLPWTRCDGWWNTPYCTSFITAPNSSRPHTNGNVTSLGEMTSLNGRGVSGSSNRSLPAMTSLNDSGVGGFWAVGDNASAGSNGTAVNQSTDVITNTVGHVKLVTAAEEFWQHNVLQKSGGLYETGEVVWYLAVCQVVVILCTFLALVKGIKTSGKIWIQAALQVFYSLAIAWGVCQTLASFNHFHNNVLRDCVMITLIGEGTSVYAGFAVFSILGYLADQSSVPIDQVVSSGPGLAFVVYPEALSLMPLSQLWAVLFFLMLVTVVIDTQLATGETMFTVLSDQFLRTLLRHGLLVRVVVTLLVLLSSLILVTQGGVYVFQLVDWYVGSYTTTVIALLECVVVGWVYGVDRFGEDVEMMIGRKPPKIMNILWRFVFPVCFAALLVFTLAEYEAPTYGDYQYDTWATVIGWMIATVSFLPIPVVAVIQLLRAKGSLLQRLKDASRPDKEWGPSDKSLYSTPIHNSKYASHV